MKRSVVILVVCLVAFAIAFAEADKRTFLAKNDRDRQASFASFKSFVEQHKKDYKTIEEFQERFTIFSQNLARIDELNKKSESARFGITPFADLTPLEFKNKYLSKVPAIPDPSLPVAADLDTSNLPESWDWREKGAVTPVKNQGQCGSCWSFSTTGNVEGQWYLAGNPLTSLSEQNLVDCDHECMMYEGEESCDSGCNGGLQPNAYNYIIKNGGIDTEEAYPYTAQDGTCKFTASKIGAKIDNFTMISQDEDQIAAYLVAHGPLAIAADAVEWQFYVGGVFDLPCSKNLDHGILIVGYGVSDDGVFARRKPYWIIKNSWGTAWGEKGYMRIHRGVGKCGLNTFVSSAIINKD